MTSDNVELSPAMYLWISYHSFTSGHYEYEKNCMKLTHQKFSKIEQMRNFWWKPKNVHNLEMNQKFPVIRKLWWNPKIFKSCPLLKPKKPWKFLIFREHQMNTPTNFNTIFTNCKNKRIMHELLIALNKKCKLVHGKINDLANEYSVNRKTITRI